MSPNVYKKDDRFRNLYLNTETGVWYVRKKKRGKKPLFKSTGETQKLRAHTKAELIIAEWMGSKRGPGYKAPLFSEFAKGYLEHLEAEKKLRPKTMVNARLHLNQLIAEIGYIPIDQINEGFYEEWLAKFRTRTTRKTFNDYAVYLGKALRHAYRNELILRLPKFAKTDPKKETGRVYTQQEIKDLLKDASPDFELQVRLALNCFMRLREALYLSWERVDLSRGLITLRAEDVKTGSRTGRGRSFYVNALVLTLLKRHRERQLAEETETPFVFPSPKDPRRPIDNNKTAWKTAKRRAGILGRARWHDLRHTALTWALVGDDAFQSRIAALTPEQQEEEQRRVLVNPLLVSAYAGVNLVTIQKVYLKVKPEHTREVAHAVKF